VDFLTEEDTIHKYDIRVHSQPSLPRWFQVEP
jgi:hypothetical protein